MFVTLFDTMPCPPPDFDAPSDEELDAADREYQEALAADEARASCRCASCSLDPPRLMSDEERAAFRAAHPSVDVARVRTRLLLGAV